MPPKKQKLNYFLIIFFILVLAATKIVFAEPTPQNQESQTNSQESVFTPEIDYPTFAGQEPTKSLPDYISYIYKFAIGSAGFLAMLMLVIGGIRLISAGGNPQAIVKAREQILNSIIGLAIILLSASIINLINPDLLVLKEASVSQYTPGVDFETLAKEWKEKHTPSGGGSSSSTLYVGAVYNAGKKIDDCYIPEELYTGNEDLIILKYLISGNAEGYTCDNLDQNENSIYCDTLAFSSDDWEKEDAKIEFCEKICEIGSSCKKVEGYIDDCKMPATCAEVKARGIKNDCNDNYIYCLTAQVPPESASGGGGGTGGGGGGTSEGGVDVGCPCDHPLEGPPRNGYTCPNSPETSGYCAVYEVCYNKACYSVVGEGKCFCIDDKNYKCLKHTVTPEGIDMIETIKEGSCGAADCSGITNYPSLPCSGGSRHIPE